MDKNTFEIKESLKKIEKHLQGIERHFQAIVNLQVMSKAEKLSGPKPIGPPLMNPTEDIFNKHMKQVIEKAYKGYK